MCTIIKNLKWFSLLLMMTFSFSNFQSGEWRLSPEAGAMAVGWDAANVGGWWSSSLDDVTARGCLFDDEYVFNADGTFQNVLGDATWLEGWQGVDEGCGAPVAPHDGSNPATWSMDEAAGTLTLNGLGAYLGLSKVTNQGENGVADNNTIVYNYSLSEDGHSMDLTANYPSGVWGFKLKTSESIDADPCADVTCGDWEECSEGTCVEIPNVDLTFNLDMSGATLGEGVFVGGGSLGGPGDNQMTDDDGDGVYTTTLTVATNSSSHYTYLTCGWWDCKENIAGQDCADANNYNDRFLSWGEEDVTVNACFGLCGDGMCSDLTPPAEVNVTFSVDMSGVDTHPEGVYVAGGGFGQDGLLMDDSDGDDVWTVTAPLMENSTHYYKFRNQPSFGTWDGFEDAQGLIDGGCAGGQYNDRFVDTGDSDMVLATVSYGSCTLDEVESELVVSYDFAVDITGFQFDVSGVEILSASGGAAGDYFDLVQANATTVVGVSFSNTPIPAGSGVLTTLTVAGNLSDASITNVTLTDVDAQEANSSVNGFEILNLPLDCAGVPGGDSFLDCEGNCLPSFYLGWVGDGYCDNGAFGAYLLCDDFNLDDGDCNDDCGVLLGDNSSCADDCGVPYGDNSSCSDCNGTPYGTAELDYCGVCDGPNVALDCPEPVCEGYTVSMLDSYGDGWSGNVLTIGDAAFTIESGASAEGCYEGPMDVAVACGGGSWGSEVSWTLTGADGSVVLSGGAPFNGCLGDCGTVEEPSLADACASVGGYFCGDDQTNWTSYSPDGCVPSFYICDGYGDCADGSDEGGCAASRVEMSEDIDAAKKSLFIQHTLEQERRISNPIALPEVTRDEDCGGTGPDIGCDGVCFSGLVDDCSGECGGTTLVDDCGVCDGSSDSCASISFGEYSYGSVDILYSTGASIGGFQFDITGATVTGASGGASDAFDAVSTSSSTVLGFSFTGATIEPSEGDLLVNVSLDAEPGDEVCFSDPVLSSGSGNTMLTVGGDCMIIPSELEILYDFREDVTGFQFNMEGVEILSASGGAAGEYFDLVDANTTTVVGISFSNTPIPAGSGVLTTLIVVGDLNNASITNVTLTDANALEIIESGSDGFTIGTTDCADVVGGDSYLDCADVCGGTAVEDCAGECQGSSLEDNCGNCDDNPFNDCEQDCAGEWGGSAEEDQCGVCGGDNSSCLATLSFGEYSDGVIEVLYTSLEDVGGFQFGITGATVTGASGGASDTFDAVSTSASTVLGFSFTGATISAADGELLVNVSLDIEPGSAVCLSNPVLSGEAGNTMVTSAGYCFLDTVEELSSYDSSVDIDVPEIVFEDVEVNIDIPAGALDVPEGTEVILEVAEASQAELQNIIDNSSSADAELDVYQGVSFDAVDENGEAIELAEGATLDVELTFETGRSTYDLGYITYDGEIVALGADCTDNGNGSWTCAGDGPGFGSYVAYSYDPNLVVEGCMDENACGNYNPDATLNDGSCIYVDLCGDCGGGNLSCSGCTDSEASNYDSEATLDDNSCEYGYSFTHELISGNNLISLPGYLNNPDAQDLMNTIINGGTDVIFLLGQGLGLFNTVDGWSGNLTTIDPHSGYWINTADAHTWDILFEAGSVADCEVYETSSGNNLLSYKWGNGSSPTLEALGGESFATDNFNFILGQGLGLFNTDNGWSGNLTNLIEGKGYWLNIKDQGVDGFRWGFDNCASSSLGRSDSETINSNKLMYDEFKFIQSTEQAFYLVEEVTVDGIEPSYDDVLLAYNGDVLIGSAYWSGRNTAVPVMGKDMSDATNGFAEYGDNIDFRLYSANSGEIYQLEGSKENWSSLLVSSINKLTGSSIEIPNVLTLNPAFPNPFNPSTKLSFGLPKDGNIAINVFDVNGRLVSSVVNSFMAAGSYEVEWNGINQPSGMYLVKVQFENEIRTEKIMLVK